MRLVPNTGTDRVVDALRAALVPGAHVDLASPELSLFAFAELRPLLERLGRCRLVLPLAAAQDLALLGGDDDRAARNRLHARWLAARCAAWVERATDVRGAGRALPQAVYIARDGDAPLAALNGACAFTTEGLGLAPAAGFGIAHAAERPAEADALGTWFDGLWGRWPGGARCPTRAPGRRGRPQGAGTRLPRDPPPRARRRRRRDR